MCDRCSLGMALTDTLDDLIGNERIDPQVAMKILQHFDRVMADTLAERVKARLSFKVRDARDRIRARGLDKKKESNWSKPVPPLPFTDNLVRAGLSRHLSFLRRSLDLPHQKRDL